MPGYTFQDKKQIVDKFILPKALEGSGLKGQESKYEIDEKVIELLINDYSREAGLRNLSRLVNQICEKIAFKLVMGLNDGLLEPESKYEVINPIKVDAQSLKDFIPPKTFMPQKMYLDKPPVGVSIGLGYNSLGGSLIYIESTSRPNPESTNQKPQITGQLGSVMNESVLIALTYARTYLSEFRDSQKLLSRIEPSDVAIHFPEGANKKDGPSAGIAIATALVSLALQEQVPEDLGMTGEITLNGKVLPIGGVEVKLMAAKREGLKRLILPTLNKQDLDQVSDDVKEGMEFLLVDNYS